MSLAILRLVANTTGYSLQQDINVAVLEASKPTPVADLEGAEPARPPPSHRATDRRRHGTLVSENTVLYYGER